MGCRAVRPQSELVRLVLAAEGLVRDEKKALPGRGAYVCSAETCATRAARHLAKALRVPSLAVDAAEVWRVASGRAAQEDELAGQG